MKYALCLCRKCIFLLSIQNNLVGGVREIFQSLACELILSLLCIFFMACYSNVFTSSEYGEEPSVRLTLRWSVQPAQFNSIKAVFSKYNVKVCSRLIFYGSSRTFPYILLQNTNTLIYFVQGKVCLQMFRIRATETVGQFVWYLRMPDIPDLTINISS